ncbi:MAG TPA: response regulator, partial [Candidatus Cloacimonas sp.]|nr:response regulator [Candidatus Cloacimonas sp.]
GSEGFERSYEGSGLGLTIAQKYAHLLGVDITLKSEPGKGSEFNVCFPSRMCVFGDQLPGEEQKTADKETSLPAHLSAQLPRILLIDDDPVIHQLAGYMLSEVALIEPTSDGEKALEYATRNRYAAIMLDIHLKGRLGGLQVLQKLKSMKNTETIPVIAVTAYSMLGDKEHFLSLGCSHYLSKPFSRQELLELMLTILTSSQGHETS